MLRIRLLTALTIFGLIWVVGMNTLCAEPRADLSTERARVLMLLKAYDSFPTAAQFKSVARNPQGLLFDIYQDTTVNHGVRLQALDALSLMPDDEVKALFLDILGGCWTPPTARDCHRALNGLMHGFAATSLDDAAAFLQHPDLQMRLTAVHAIARSGGDPGRDTLLTHLNHEKSPLVRTTIEKMTARLR